MKVESTSAVTPWIPRSMIINPVAIDRWMESVMFQFEHNCLCLLHNRTQCVFISI
ncbi:hypothetical protein RchiOBHm_Chr7g0187051 [Rosa chinensis]|uniref:Uncharacterized protein n=1 Tax=Rosa chinensis TaxID=74649 RepID=A0A2P6P446_ROSCH|nr:hypothetical protein RchiOBHm_Chr7g0187051 [Rosa chinensis]